MAKVVVVGGGLAGCGAALAAKKAGAEVTLLERTDRLTGMAPLTGETWGNGWFVGMHELRFLGGEELPDIIQSLKLHDRIRFPDIEYNTFLYNCGLIEPRVRAALREAGVQVGMECQVVHVVKEAGFVRAVKTKTGRQIEADAFVDTTGTRGGTPLCNKYASGCTSCLARCMVFGNRVSVVEKAGGKEWHRIREDGTPGRVTFGMTVFKESLAPSLQKRLENQGFIQIPVPSDLLDRDPRGYSGSGRSREFAEYIQLGDIGMSAKFFCYFHAPLERLRRIPGFEDVVLQNPGTPKFGGIHTSAIAIAYRDNSLKVQGFQNLFCGGDKGGDTSVDAAVLTGCIAGHNAARCAAGREPLTLPRSLALGDWIAYGTERYTSGEGQRKIAYCMNRGEYWDRMLQTGLYTDDVEQIEKRVRDAGLVGVLAQKVV